MLPFGTGNDLARVLGWGSAFDDDTQLPAILEKLEHSQIKMLDRWVKGEGVGEGGGIRLIRWNGDQPNCQLSHRNWNILKSEFHFLYLGFTAFQNYFTHFEPSQSLVGWKQETIWPPRSRTWLDWHDSHVTQTGLKPIVTAVFKLLDIFEIFLQFFIST